MGCSSSQNQVDVAKQINHSALNFVTKLGDVSEITQKYDIKEVIADRAYGRIYMCTQKTTLQKFAFKKIIKRLITSDGSDKSFLNDVQIIKQLDHPNILKMYEVYQDSFYFYVIEELCEGITLYDYLYTNKEASTNKDILTIKQAASIIKQILYALVYAHDKKIAHRDLKPENIIMFNYQNENEKDFKIKIIDWGSGGQLSSNRSYFNEVVGTQYYISPQILEKKYTEKCDIWSIGVILYEIMYRELPFQGDTPEALAKAIFKGEIKKEKGQDTLADDDCKDLIQHLLTKDEKKRFSAKDAINHKWFATDSNAPVCNEKLNDLYQAMQKTSAKNLLQKAAKAYIVQLYFNDEKKKQLDQMFLSLDKDKNGTIDKQEIEAFFKKDQTQGISQEQIEQIITKLDINNDGIISYNEFISNLAQQDMFFEDTQLQKAFEFFDTDGNQQITKEEFKQLFPKESNINQIWDQIMKDHDKNGDKKLNFEEFKAMLKDLKNQPLDNQQEVQKPKTD